MVGGGLGVCVTVPPVSVVVFGFTVDLFERQIDDSIIVDNLRYTRMSVIFLFRSSPWVLHVLSQQQASQLRKRSTTKIVSHIRVPVSQIIFDWKKKVTPVLSGIFFAVMK